MTYATLSTIHDLLEKEKKIAERMLELYKSDYYEELEQTAEQLGSNAKAHKAMIGRAVTTGYEDSMAHFERISDALEEFNAQDWR